MLLIINLHDININNILYNKSKENNIIKDSEFIKILYSNDIHSLNSIIININFNYLYISYKYNKVYFKFDTTKNIDIISKLVDLENNLLNLLNENNLQPLYNLKHFFLVKNVFSVNNQNNQNNKKEVYLKISGVWKNSKNYGLIFKFI